MADYDLLIRHATQVPLVGISDGKIAGFEEGSAREEFDATGLLLLPGAIDAHVHFNEPGRTEWEGWATGSRAAVAGGVTMVCDMPLNSTPPVVTVEAFEAKRRAAEAQAICDFALWGGLIPGHVEDLEPLADAGVMGLKAFMAHSGIDDFPKVDLATLRAGMRRAAGRGLPVAVHAEFDRPRLAASSVASSAASSAAGPGAGMNTTVADYLASRPIESECEAIRAAIDIAGETGCALHVVHVSSGRGVSLIAEARARGVDVTAETCPHYLLFTDVDMERLGAVAKCAPPFRSDRERAALLEHVHAGRVETIGSDHSPSPWSLKTSPDFFRVWGGIAGIQHLLPLLLDVDAGVGLEARLVARLTAEQVARRFRFSSKGRLAVGCDADLVLIDMGASADKQVTVSSMPREDKVARSSDADPISADSLLYRHRVSPYVGRRLRTRVRRTLRRGHTVFEEAFGGSGVTADRGGRLVRPDFNA